MIVDNEDETEMDRWIMKYKVIDQWDKIILTIWSRFFFTTWSSPKIESRAVAESWTCVHIYTYLQFLISDYFSTNLILSVILIRILDHVNKHNLISTNTEYTEQQLYTQKIDSRLAPLLWYFCVFVLISFPSVGFILVHQVIIWHYQQPLI